MPVLRQRHPATVNQVTSDKSFAGSDIRYLTRGTYPSSDSLAGHIRCGTIGTKTSCPVQTLFRPKKYPLRLTERSETT